MIEILGDGVVYMAVGLFLMWIFYRYVVRPMRETIREAVAAGVTEGIRKAREEEETK